MKAQTSIAIHYLDCLIWIMYNTNNKNKLAINFLNNENNTIK
jgi:hypothetical protein